MVENKPQFAKKIGADEVNSLLHSFWGKESPLAEYCDPLIDFDYAMEKLNALLKLPKERQLAKVLECFSNKTISLGIRCGDNLIAHSALIIHSWGQVETAGSIISESFKGYSLMNKINERKKELISRFALLGIQPVSYVLLGSRSVEYGYLVFDIPEIGLTSWFCNIGPYVFSRPLIMSSSKNSLVRELSLETESACFSSSAQIVGLMEKNPPLVFLDSQKYLPHFWKDLLGKYPKKEVGYSERYEGNDIYGTKANIIVMTIRNEIQDLDLLMKDVVANTLNGKTVTLQIPLTQYSSLILEQIIPRLSMPIGGVRFIPTGLAIVDRSWAICISTICDDRIPHYLELMLKTRSIYKGSLKYLAELSYYYLNKDKLP